MTDEKFWTAESAKAVHEAMPPWMGNLALRSGVPSRLSPRDVAKAIERFVAEDYGEGHPEGVDNPDWMGCIFATYRATDFVPNEPFYVRWTPENQMVKLNPALGEEGEHPAYTEILTWSDY